MTESAKFHEKLKFGLKTVENHDQKIGRVLVVITNRSSYSKVKTVIEGMVALNIEVILVLGGSMWVYKYGACGNEVCADFPELTKYTMDTIIEGNTNAKMADSVGVLTTKLTTIIEKEHPDLVVTIADRFETLGTAIAASYMNVDLVHIQGGEVSGTIDGKARDAVTALSDWHFPASEAAAKRVATIIGYGDIDGCESAYHGITMDDIDEVNNYGCPSMDLLNRYQPDGTEDELKEVFIELHSHGTGYLITQEVPYMIVMYHPDTREYDRSIRDLGILVDCLKKVKCQKIVFWPNIDSHSDEISKVWRHGGIDGTRYIRHLDRKWFARLLWFSSGIIGNSSAGIREASFYGVPSVTIGGRQCGRDHGGSVMHVDPAVDDLSDAIGTMLSMEKKPSMIYGTGDAGNKIASKIASVLEDA